MDGWMSVKTSGEMAVNKYTFIKKFKELTYNAPTVNAPLLLIGKHIEKKHFRKPPILIVASPRSGTTLLFSMLAALPAVFAARKQTNAFDRWEERGGKWVPLSLFRLHREFLMHRIPDCANRWLEKTPSHIRSLDKILQFFNEDVKIIHLIRDGRDVVVSSHPAYLNRRKYWVPIEWWVKDVKSGLRYRDHPSVHTMHYEDLIRDYDTEIRKVLTFIDEPFSPEIADWVGHTPIKQSIHWGSGVRQVHSQAIGNWRKPEHARRIAEFMKHNEAVELLHALGYDSMEPMSSIVHGHP